MGGQFSFGNKANETEQKRVDQEIMDFDHEANNRRMKDIYSTYELFVYDSIEDKDLKELNRDSLIVLNLCKISADSSNCDEKLTNSLRKFHFYLKSKSSSPGVENLVLVVNVTSSLLLFVVTSPVFLSILHHSTTLKNFIVRANELSYGSIVLNKFDRSFFLSISNIRGRDLMNYDPVFKSSTTGEISLNESTYNFRKRLETLIIALAKYEETLHQEERIVKINNFYIFIDGTKNDDLVTNVRTIFEEFSDVIRTIALTFTFELEVHNSKSQSRDMINLVKEILSLRNSLKGSYITLAVNNNETREVIKPNEIFMENHIKCSFTQNKKLKLYDIVKLKLNCRVDRKLYSKVKFFFSNAFESIMGLLQSMNSETSPLRKIKKKKSIINQILSCLPCRRDIQETKIKEECY